MNGDAQNAPRENQNADHEPAQRSPITCEDASNHGRTPRGCDLAKKSFGQTAPCVTATMASRPFHSGFVSPRLHRVTTDRSRLTRLANWPSVSPRSSRYSFNVMG